MNGVDYESLFIYMSLVFAIIIFVIILFGCGGVAFSGNRVYENFLEYPTDIKIQIASTFSDYEKKLTDADEKKKINGIIEKINNNKKINLIQNPKTQRILFTIKKKYYQKHFC